MFIRTSAALIVALFMAGVASAATFTVALVDCSGSMLQDAELKDSPFNRNLQELKTEIGRLDKNDRLLAIAFGKKSEVQIIDVTMPRVAGPRGNNLKATREAAIRKLMENLRNNTAQIDRSRTDLVGSLSKAARIFSESSSPSKRLLVYSDCIDNESIKLSLKKLTAGSHKQLLKKLDSAGIPYPKLQNVSVDIYAVFASVKDLSGLQSEVAIAELKSLWSEYFRRCGTLVSSYRTSIY